MGLIIVAIHLPSLLRAWDTLLARVLVGDLPLGMSLLSFRVWFLKKCWGILMGRRNVIGVFGFK